MEISLHPTTIGKKLKKEVIKKIFLLIGYVPSIIIVREMSGKSCVVVLVGSNTAGRKWINHEIIKGWDDGKGIVGIYIHGLKDSNGNISTKGDNPFDSIGYGSTGKKLSSIVKCYNPAGSTSQEKYNWIKNHLANAVEEAIRIRKEN